MFPQTTVYGTFLPFSQRRQFDGFKIRLYNGFVLQLDSETFLFGGLGNYLNTEVQKRAAT